VTLAPIGRAVRSPHERGERWEIDDRAIEERLLTFGRAGVGGFASIDGSLVRVSPGKTLAIWWREPRPWREVIDVIRGVARALDACEREGLFPGPIGPDVISVDPIVVRADALVSALAGAPRGEGSSHSGKTKWMSPEQAQGAPWDNAANRYVLGLVMYRALTGEHAFAGRGMRLGLEDQAGRGAPPFPDGIARELPPGLQSLCLKLLDPDPNARPRSARAIVDALASMDAPARIPPPAAGGRGSGGGGGERGARTRESPLPPSPPTARGGVDVARRGTRRVNAATWIAVASAIGSLAIAGVVLAFVGDPERRAISPRDVIAPASTMQDCASCHPRQSAEWRRSVMSHAAVSPLFQALEILIEEQVGRDRDCPNGAGILRGADPNSACRDRTSGLAVTGSGGELWCVNCHAPGENLAAAMPAWDAHTPFSRSRAPIRELLPASSMEGISCAFCHQAHAPARPGLAYEGNPSWTSTRTGRRFPMRPEDARGIFGIGNSGYSLDPNELIRTTELGGVHARPTESASRYLRSSEFCGACHDVRLFGSDGLRNEPFKRLRNAYSEWVDWSAHERAAGRAPASCQDCHMSRFPGVCVPGDADRSLPSSLARACPPGTVFEARSPGDFPDVLISSRGGTHRRGSTHYLSGVDVPLGEFPEEAIDDATLDLHGIPLGARQRRDVLLGRTFRFELEAPRRTDGGVDIPLVIENVGAGHRVPAGFSQEREIWVHLRVTDARGNVIYEVGRVDRGDEDLRDKIFERVTTSAALVDRQGRPLGLFGADVRDGPDVPRWEPPPDLGGTSFRGRGLINLQNGFLRCVSCIGVIDALGRCQPGPGQGLTRADRFADGAFDPDTGICTSNLTGREAYLETYFPIGSLDADRGVVRGPDAIIDTRSAAPNVPLRYVYDLPITAPGPLTIEARLMFRAFPPFLIRAFAAYERSQPRQPLVTDEMLERLDVVELAAVRAEVP
jgi:hypothetical protein